MKKKILVGMSGGVDSSVAALLLKRRGYDVWGGFIRGYNVDGCQDNEMRDASHAARQIGIPFHVFDFEKEYKHRVVDMMLEGYREGITPNPDVVCNSQIKFGLLYDVAMDMGFEAIGSGHYALLRKESLIPNLSSLKPFKKRAVHVYAAKDKEKDQSYFLWQVSYERFSNILFPLGIYHKSQVRDIARGAGLDVSDKKDSQGVCFLGKFNFGEFLREHLPVQKGEIVDIYGKTVGEHDGTWFYTIGQRHGFSNTAGVPFFVVKKEVDTNRLVVAYEGDEQLYSYKVVILTMNFLDSNTKKLFYEGKKINVWTRVRYRQKLGRSTLRRIDNDKGEILFDKKEKLFPASGQSAVFYNKKEQMLGGGIIQ